MLWKVGWGHTKGGPHARWKSPETKHCCVYGGGGSAAATCFKLMGSGATAAVCGCVGELRAEGREEVASSLCKEDGAGRQERGKQGWSAAMGGGAARKSLRVDGRNER